MQEEIIHDVTPENAGVESFEQDSQGEEITLDDLGDKVDGSAMDTGGKPVFEKNTLAKVNTVELNRLFEPKLTRDGKSEYTPIIVKVEIETKDGQKSFDNYGGLRETDNGLWCGGKSAFGKLKALVIEEIGDDATWRDIFEYLNSGISVKVKTETTTYGGKNFQKNIIKQIL